MSGPTAGDVLTVQVTDPRPGGRTLTWPCPRDLRFTTTAPGGFDTLSCTFTWADPGAPPADVLRASAVIQVVDRTSGDVVWYGTIDDPGNRARAGTRSWKVTATGERRILERQTEAYALCDRDLGNWVDKGQYPQGSVNTGDGSGFVAHGGDWPTDDPTGYLELTIPDGSKLVSTSRMPIYYRPQLVAESGGDPKSTIVWMFFSHMGSGGGGTIYFADGDVGDSSNVFQQPTHTAWSSSQVDESAAQWSGAWTMTNAKQAFLRWAYTGTATSRTSDGWLRFANIAVYFQVVDKDGNLLSPNGSVISLHAGGIMHDMLGRHLAGLVDTGATVFYPTSPQVDQAAWWGGASGREIADFVQSIQPDYWWAVWEPGVSGLPRFEYRTWKIGGNGVASNAFRYQLSPRDSRVEFAGGSDDVFNRALVIYQRVDGVPASVEVIGGVADLDARGEVRRATIDLSDRGPLNVTSAKSIGLSELSKLDAQRSSGTATVFGPIVDRVTGIQVRPWELLPGWIAKTTEPVEQEMNYPDLGSRDSVSLFRVTSVTFDASSGTAELALDGGARTVLRRRPSPAAPPAVVPRVGKSPAGAGKRTAR